MGTTASDSLDIPQIARHLKPCNFPYFIVVTGLYFLSLKGWTFRFAGCRARHIVGHLEREVTRRMSQSRFIGGRCCCCCCCCLLVDGGDIFFLCAGVGLYRERSATRLGLRPYYVSGPKTPQS